MFRMLATLTVCTVTCCAAATTYHVAPPASGGSDANSGLAGSPFATIQRAANAAMPGDVVIVGPGTYAGFNAVRSGTQTLPITFRAEPGVIVNTPAATYNGTAHKARINLDSVSWIVIEGFEVVGTNDLRDSKAGIRIVAPPASNFGNIVIRNNHMHHNGQWGMLTGHVHTLTVENNLAHHQHQQHGIYLSNSGDNHVVRNNISHSNAQQGFHFNGDLSQGGDGVMSNLLIDNNIAYENAIGGTYIDTNGALQTAVGGGSAINCDGVRDSIIRNNLLYANHASGVSLYRIDGGQSSANNLVVNNTIINGSASNTVARWCINITDASTGNTVFNNILLNYHPTRGSIIVSADSRPGLVSDYNIVMDRFDAGGGVITLANWRTQTGNDTHSILVPSGQWGALFVDQAGGDYRLSAASVAADAGVGALNGDGAPGVDRVGVARPSGAGWDVGAYERPSGSTCAADFDGNGSAELADVFAYLNAWFAGEARADVDGVAGLSVGDIFAFLNAWFAGC